MVYSVEHRVNCFNLARERSAAGKPSWARTIKIKHLLVPGSDPAEVGKSIGAILRAAFPLSVDMESDECDFDFAEMVEKFECITGFDGTSPVEEFAYVLDEFYTWADLNRVWVG